MLAWQSGPGIRAFTFNPQAPDPKLIFDGCGRNLMILIASSIWSCTKESLWESYDLMAMRAASTQFRF